MNKGFIQIPILIAVVLGVIVVGSTGYGIAKFAENNKKVKVETVEDVVEEDQQFKDSTATENVEVTSGESVSTESAGNPYVESYVNDLCVNIEGIQLSIPSGLSIVGNICVPVLTSDLCPNLLGIQEEIPEGRYFYQNTGQCLTESEITNIETEKFQDESVEKSKYSARFDPRFYRKEEFFDADGIDRVYVWVEPILADGTVIPINDIDVDVVGAPVHRSVTDDDELQIIVGPKTLFNSEIGASSFIYITLEHEKTGDTSSYTIPIREGSGIDDEEEEEEPLPDPCGEAGSVCS